MTNSHHSQKQSRQQAGFHNPMRFVRSVANPNGMAEAELFLLTGNAARGPVDHIEANPKWNLHRSAMTGRNNPFRLRVLHFNDLHGFISKIRSDGDSPILSRMVWLVKDLRRRYRHNPNVALLFAAGGDEQVGSLFDELLEDDRASYKTHAGYRAYSAAGVDVGVIGNHDLDRGAGLLAHAIQLDAHFPILSANVISQQHLNWLCYPAALFRVKGARVGIIGLTTAGQIKCGHPDIAIADPLETVKNLLPAFKPFCDILIILSHLGYSATADSAIVKPMGDVELAQALEYCEVDLIIGGHTHHALNETGLSQTHIVNGIPIVQAGARGQYLGSVDITFRYGTAYVTSARLMAVSNLPVEETFETQVVQPLVAEARQLLQTPLGVLADDFGLSTVVVRNYFAAEEIPLINFIADGIVTCCRVAGYPVDLAMVDASVVQSGLPRAPYVTMGMWLRLMPFADTIHIYSLTGRQLKELLNDNARRIDLPGEPHTERGFLHFSRDLRYTINVAGKDRGRCFAGDITVNGRPLDEQLDRTFAVACSSFVRRLCSAWEKYAQNRLGLNIMPFDEDHFPRVDTGLLVAREMMAYIRRQGGVTPATGAKQDGRLQVRYLFARPNSTCARPA